MNEFILSCNSDLVLVFCLVDDILMSFMAE